MSNEIEKETDKNPPLFSGLKDLGVESLLQSKTVAYNYIPHTIKL